MTLNDLFALLPLVILVFGAIAVLMLSAWWSAPRTFIGIGAAICLFAAAASLLWPSPLPEVAAMFSCGPYARFFIALWSALATLTLVLSMRYGEDRLFGGGEYTSLVLFSAAGMGLLSSATSLVGLFLGLESLTLALYILVAFHKNSHEGAEAGLKYLILGGVATGFLAFGIALLYACSGSFHFSVIRDISVSAGHLPPLALLGYSMLLVALGFKVSLVPFHLWTPDVYQGAPAPIAGLLSSGAKGAVFAMLISLLVPTAAGGSLEPLLWTLSAASMLTGTLAALKQQNIKRLLAYSSIVHMGYLLMAFLAGDQSGSTAILFYLAGYTVVSIGAFGVIASLGSHIWEPQQIARLKGLGYRHPLRCAALTVFLLSLAGIPPTAGFIGKFAIFSAAIQNGYLGLALFGILASLISVYYYLHPVVVMFMSEEDEHEAPLEPGFFREHGTLALCAALTFYLGLYPQPLFQLVSSVLP